VADGISLVDSAGLDFGHFTRGQRGFHRVNVVVDEGQVDGLILYANHVLEQIATPMRLAKWLKCEALLDMARLSTMRTAFTGYEE